MPAWLSPPDDRFRVNKNSGCLSVTHPFVRFKRFTGPNSCVPQYELVIHLATAAAAGAGSCCRCRILAAYNSTNGPSIA